MEGGIEILLGFGFLPFFQELVALFGARPEWHNKQRRAANQHRSIPQSAQSFNLILHPRP